ncbi:SusC/RagA family TonB-linked outer membrane protein [Chitinophaga sancti]|uniref:SusC/RagA family TonB-linked outer membrane protein n=1 Tax=Chitinophaga sancti TaxID=1004 RepID=A0A1K1QDA6_9BACT|nr:SusC/RagA family TonB-linked outer membrane protein [Chitinophaga sancti]WQD61384.1 SusC/RagA family TonB-linked outer membrane protein [Chitinophaga sancti]WQG93063.1 SusC/RagA family TonB-linked outer membrane protein [Chitinophaga sancti]SFW57681.1 TonB-linked outer membrane protein, SusC/RagA family [Chitinophaga sancti]
MNKLLFITCLLYSATLFARQEQLPQKKTIRGRVTDATTHMPVIGASVAELDKDKRTVTGVATDIDGNFAIRVADLQHQVSVSFISYKTVVQGINNRTTINIQLQPNTHDLNEFNVVAKQTVNNGTGLNIDARNSTLATATIQAKELEELSAASIDQALQGRLPGVDIGTTSGDPGAGMSIRIRGTASINGSANPLIVLDGMPYDTEVPSDFNFGSADEQGYAQLLNIAPSDIKEITVLKDAAATAVWGSRAANGVLIITTKRGMVGKPAITYNFKGTFGKQPRNIPLLNGDQYATLIPEEIANTNGLPLNINVNKEFLYDPSDPYWYYNYSNNTDWIKAITQVGYSQDHNISMTGGGDKARYYASIGYFDQQGTTKGTSLTRISSKINLDYMVSNRIRFRSDITYTHVDNHLNYVPDKDYQVRGIAYTRMPNMAIHEYDEYGNVTPNYLSPASNIQGYYYTTYNPVSMVMESLYRQQGERITPKFNVQYDIVPAVLTSTFDVQFDINNTKAQTFLPGVATGRPVTETVVNRAGDSDGDIFDVYTKTNLIYTPKSNTRKHQLQALLSLQTEDRSYVTHNVLTSNTASSNFQDPSNPGRTANSDLTLESTSGRTRSVGLLLQGQYGLLDRYIINAGLRGDGNSRFGPDYRYGLFPSLSVRWRTSGEKFMRKYKFIDDLSFRASYGQSGAAPPDKAVWNYFNTYQPYSYTYLGMSGVYPSNMELTSLKWQTVEGTNLGFNLWVLKNRIRIDVEAYRNRTRDMFYENLQIPAYSGFSEVAMNVGTMDNQGWEVLLNTIPYRSKNWTIGFDLNIARNVNIVRKISEFFPRENNVAINQNGVYKTYLQIGNPFGSYYGFRYKGVYKDRDATIVRDANGKKIDGANGQTLYMRFNYPGTDYVFQPGDAMYEDVNHDGNIDNKDIVYLGNGIPKVTGGFGPNITFKGNLKLTTYFVYRLGYQLVNKADMSTSNMYGYDNQSTVVLKRWRNPGDETDIPRALYRSGYNWLGSDRYVQDASFIRLQSLTLRYNFTKRILDKLNIRNASCYITVENLATWTKYKGQNPDVSTKGNNDPFSYPVDNALTPPAKNFLMGISASF